MGSIYALIALGYTMVYGIIELINFAHGEIYMIGAFTGLIVASLSCPCSACSQLSILILACVVAVIYSAAYGYTMEKVAYKPIRKAPQAKSALISAIGMSIFPAKLRSDRPDIPIFCLFRNLIPELDFWEPYSATSSARRSW